MNSNVMCDVDYFILKFVRE